MTCKYLLCAAILAALLPVAAVAADGPSFATTQNPLTPQSLDLARSILALFGSSMQAMEQQMMGSAMGGVTDPGLRQIVKSHIDGLLAQMMPLLDRYIPSIMEAQARAYAREFSTGELTQIMAFAATPTGKHMLSRSSALLRDPEVAAANQAFFAATQQLAQAGMPPLIAKMNDYVAKHPEVMPKH
jgi:Uncharacterized protein conserved in bacteria (DUF2059)